MRSSDAYTLVTALVLCAAPVSLAGVMNVFWEQNGSGWDLFASVTADTIVYNADLGDETINLPPANAPNTGLFSTNGAILDTSFLALGDETVQIAREFTISPSGTGSLADASWYATNGAVPEFDPDTGYRIWLGRFFIEEGATLGGAFGGPNADTQSRIYIGSLDDNGIGLNVFEIPITVVCDAPIIFVDANAPPNGDGESWGSAFIDVQAALQAAETCKGVVDEVWVAEGTYTPAPPGADRAISFDLLDGIVIYGGFPSGGGDFGDRDPTLYETILSGDLNGDDDTGGDNSENSYHVLRASKLANQGTSLDGFTITGGFADGLAPDNNGGGVVCDGSILTFVNCVWEANTALLGGGALNLTGSTLNLTDCKVMGNSAESGGGVGTGGSDVTLINCLFSQNVAAVKAGAVGGGMTAFTLINCTLSGNEAPDVGGLRIQGVGSNGTVVNCVLWGNGGSSESDQIGLFGGAQLSLDYSCVEGLTGDLGGVENIGDDPMFVDPDGPDDDPDTFEDNDYHLGSDSPCIDSADNLAVPKEIDEDLDGNPRFVDDPCTDDTGNGDPPIVDMGAYEFQVTCPWDLDCDGTVGASDLLSLLFLWGTDPGGPPDFDGDGIVGAADLLALLFNWGPCP